MAKGYKSDRMQVEADHYKIRPRKTRDGWNLEGERLSHGALWFQDENDAISYAKWHSRVNGCKIDILDEKDEILRTEELPRGDFAY